MEITSLSAIEHIVRFRPSRIRRLRIASDSRSSRLRQLSVLAKQSGIALEPYSQRSKEPAQLELFPFEFTPLELLTKEREKGAVLLALDHIQDPQNFGALCRSADALGATGILLPKDRTVSIGPGVYAASAGSVETIPICRVNNLSNCLRCLKEMEYWIIGTSLSSESPPWEIPELKRIVLILGSENEGLSSSMQKLCDFQCRIPLTGKVASLNVSNAGACLLYELLRRNLLQTR